MTAASRYRIGFDIGGTFTDFILLDTQHNDIRLHKCLTTPRDPSVGALEGLVELLQAAGLTLADIGDIVHGTTLVTNALIERSGACLGLITTRGFRDILEMGTEQRYDIYDLFLLFPDPLVPRRHRLEVAESDVVLYWFGWSCFPLPPGGGGGDQRTGSGATGRRCCSVVGADLQDVAKAARGGAGRGGRRCARSGALVTSAVDHIADLGEGQSGCLQQFGEALQRANRGVVRRGQAFVEADSLRRIEQDEVGEGAADVETDTIAVGGRHPGFPAIAAVELCTAADGVSRVRPTGGASVRLGRFHSTQRKVEGHRGHRQEHEMRFARSACCCFSVALC